MRALLARLLAVRAVLGAWRRREEVPPTARPRPDPAERRVPRDGRAELLAAALLLVAAALALAFVGLLAFHDDTQLLGLSLGLAFACLAAALIVAGKAIVPQETAVEERVPFVRPDELQGTVEEVERGADGVSRRRLLAGAGGAAGLAMGAALVAPAASLGPRLGESIHATPWRRGRRLVDTQGRRYRPRGHRHRELLHRAARGRRRPRPRRRAGGRAAARGDAAPPARAPRLGAGRGARVLQDLPARGLRGLALSLAAVRADLRRAGAGLPLPLLDVRPHDGAAS